MLGVEIPPKNSGQLEDRLKERKTMTPQEIEKLVAKNVSNIKADRDRVIGSRRYNLVVFAKENGEKKIIETIEYLTMRQARELKKEYREEDGYRCDIIEDVTTDRNGNEIVFTEKVEPPIVKGIGGFNTPEATKRIIERDRRNNRSKASFARKERKVKSGKTIRYENAWNHPASTLYPMYLDNVKRRGFTVIVKPLHQKFVGLQEEVAEFIYSLLKTGNYTKNDLDIRFNGV